MDLADFGLMISKSVVSVVFPDLHITFVFPVGPNFWLVSISTCNIFFTHFFNISLFLKYPELTL